MCPFKVYIHPKNTLLILPNHFTRLNLAKLIFGTEAKKCSAKSYNSRLYEFPTGLLNRSHNQGVEVTR